MARAPSTFRKRDVRIAVEAVVAAGAEVARVEVNVKDGKIAVVVGKPCADQHNPWDAAVNELESGIRRPRS
jgi:hypothetical protein